jgi:hypothetical protein
MALVQLLNCLEMVQGGCIRYLIPGFVPYVGPNEHSATTKCFALRVRVYIVVGQYISHNTLELRAVLNQSKSPGHKVI